MSSYSENYCDFQQFLLFRNKARNAGHSRKNAGNKPKCGIFRTIAGRLTPVDGYCTGMDKTCVYTSFYGFICMSGTRPGRTVSRLGTGISARRRYQRG